MSISQTQKGWKVDVQPGGRKGTQRIRETFIRKEDAKAFEIKVKAEWQSGKLRGGSLANMMIGDFLNLYKNRYVAVYVKNPKHAVIPRLNMYAKFFGLKKVGDLTIEDGDKFVEEFKRKGHAIGSLNRYIGELKTIFNWAIGKGYLTVHPFKGLTKLRGDKPRARWLKDEEIESIFNFCKVHKLFELQDVIWFALNTGFRRDNLRLIEIKDVNFKDKVITAKKTKSGSPYDVPFIDGMEQFLGRVVGERTEGLLFPRMNYDDRFTDVTKAIGLYKDAKDQDKVTLHVLRHTFAAHLLRAGKSIYAVQKWLGHSSVKMTESVYGHLCKEFQKEHIKGVSIGGEIS